MTINNFETFLNRFSEKDWLAALEKLLPNIHEVDRNAVQIWFRFYPLELFRYLQTAEDREKALQKFVLQGDFELKDQIDTSHKFLYGHRFWKETKTAIESYAASFKDENADLSQIIEAVAAQVKAEKAFTLGIAAVGLMTFNRVKNWEFISPKGFQQLLESRDNRSKSRHIITQSITKAPCF